METKTNEENLKEFKGKIEEIKKLINSIGKDKVNLLLLTQIDSGDHYDSGIVVCGSTFSIAKMVCEAAKRDEFIDRLLHLASNKSEMLIIEGLQKMLMGEEPESTEKKVAPDKETKNVSVPEPELTETR